MWVAGETGPAVADGQGWTTAVASVVVSSAPQPSVVAVPPPPPRLRAREASGRAGDPLRLSYLALADGVHVRREVTVRRGTSVVFKTTSPAGRLHAQRVYAVAWRPAKGLRGSFRFCVRSVLPDGTASPLSCSTVRLR